MQPAGGMQRAVIGGLADFGQAAQVRGLLPNVQKPKASRERGREPGGGLRGEDGERRGGHLRDPRARLLALVGPEVGQKVTSLTNSGNPPSRQLGE